MFIGRGPLQSVTVSGTGAGRMKAVADEAAFHVGEPRRERANVR